MQPEGKCEFRACQATKNEIQHLQYAYLYEDVLINLNHKHKKWSDISALFSLVIFSNSLIGPVIIQPVKNNLDLREFRFKI